MQYGVDVVEGEDRQGGAELFLGDDPQAGGRVEDERGAQEVALGGGRTGGQGTAPAPAASATPENLRVAVFGTGGMSHQLAGARAGLIN
ncbi:hypothetical protein ACH4TV_12965 [Streptomyces sp. NPDC020898]|uniref:hypothetical protein n=1 Tax=Streptomyces sp. NPDC020898 TaxID=3365101 RepID=UPI0037BDB888